MNTYTEVISIVDKRMPNAYTDEEKLKWMYDLDLAMWRDVIRTHVNSDNYTEPQENVNVLLVADPFAEDIYVPYLQAKIAWHNEEDARYDRYIAKFNEGYDRWTRWYNESHRPLPCGEYWRF